MYRILTHLLWDEIIVRLTFIFTACGNR